MEDDERLLRAKKNLFLYSSWAIQLVIQRCEPLVQELKLFRPRPFSLVWIPGSVHDESWSETIVTHSDNRPPLYASAGPLPLYTCLSKELHFPAMNIPALVLKNAFEDCSLSTSLLFKLWMLNSNLRLKPLTVLRTKFASRSWSSAKLLTTVHHGGGRGYEMVGE